MNPKKATTLAITLGILLNVSTLLAATAHDWLAAQQYPTGLVDSFEGDNSTVSYTYDQACAIIAFTCENDLVRAKRVLDAMMPLQFAEGSWANGHYADTATRTSTWRRSGETLWMMLAINYYTRKTGDTTYVNACKKAADWIISLQETNTADARYGSIYGGLTDTGARETWTSTEHNYDAYSALYYIGDILNNQYYKDKAQLVYNWLVNKMWDNNAGRFYTGANDYSVYLDPQSWSIVAIGKTGPAGQDFSRSITYAYNMMHLTRTLNSQPVDGFDYDGTITAPGGGVWFEGTEQMVLTYETLGDMTKANYFHSQTAKAQSANGGVLCAVGDGGDYWPTNFNHNAVATTSWYILCSQSPRVNPFKPPVASADTTAPVLSSITSTGISANSATITWTTNESADSQVEYGLTTAYGTNTTLNTSLVLSHSVTMTGLSASTLYHYRVKSKDAAGNLATSADYTFTTSAAGDTTAPVISSVTSSGLTSNSATINWTTNENSDTQVEYGLTTSYGSSSTLNASLVTSHSAALSGLTANTLHHYRVKSKDAAGNLATSSDYSFTTAASSAQTKNYAPKAISVTQGTGQGSYTDLGTDNNVFYSVNAMQNGTLFYTDWYAATTITEAKSSVSKITITFNGHYTSPQDQGLYLYNFASSVWARLDYQSVGTADQTITFSTTDIASYLSATGEIRLRIYTERTSNVCCYSDYVNFAVDINTVADTIPPTLSTIQSSAITASGAAITWTTNENSDSQVEYGLTTGYGSSSTLNTSLVTSHSVILTGLNSSTLYHYRVKSKDAAGNLATSADYSFTTATSTTPQTKNYKPTLTVVSKGTGGGIYLDLAADDNIFYSVNAKQNGTLFYTDWYARTVITESPSTLTKLVLTFNGHYTSPQVQSIHIYNFTTSAWDQKDSQTVGTAEQTISVTLTTNLTSYVSSTGEIRMRMYTERTDNVCVYADYINFAVDFNGTIDTTAPVLSSIASSSITTTGATITWTTNENSDTQVEYGKTTSYGSSSTLNTSLVTSHSVALSGLTANTLYHYRVKSKDAAGNLATSADYSFTTVALPSGKSYNPTGISVSRGTVTGNYTYLNNNDGTYLIITGNKVGTTYATDWYAKTVIAEPRSQVIKLTITYDGRLNRSTYQNLYLYNFVTSVWARMDYQAVSTTDKTITITSTAIASYISASGEIRLRNYVTNSSNLTCYADQVKFNIELNTTAPTIQNIDSDAPAAPDNGEVILYNNLFNPAKGESARIDYTIDNDGQVTIKLYNIAGELVRTLVDESRSAGTYIESWNGKNSEGETVASGIYLCFIEAPGIKVIKKAAVIK